VGDGLRKQDTTAGSGFRTTMGLEQNRPDSQTMSGLQNQLQRREKAKSIQSLKALWIPGAGWISFTWGYRIFISAR